MNNPLKKTICLFSIIFSFLITSAQSIRGTWNGTLHIQPKDIPIVFHIALGTPARLWRRLQVIYAPFWELVF